MKSQAETVTLLHKHSDLSLSLVSSTLPIGWFPESDYLSSILESAAIYPGKRNFTSKKESKTSFAIETFIPFLLAGVGMAGAGLLLDRATNWTFLREMPEAMILVPALLGLKGNLEMTLASRLSTMANLGLMDTKAQQLRALISNVSLVQAQAIVVSFGAALLTICTFYVEGNGFHLSHVISLTLISVLTAVVASLILSTLMVIIAIVARKVHINPDNIATPLAATTGDVTTLAFLILFGTWINQNREENLFIYTVFLGLLLSSSIIWMIIASRNTVTNEVLKYGWFAIMAGMVISSTGGYIMKGSHKKFPDVALFQPVINGVGGNLVAVQASRISTYLHKFGKMGILPANSLLTYFNPLRTFSCDEDESTQAVILLLMCVPGHIIFLLLIFAVEIDFSRFNFIFLFLYLVVGAIQVALLLYFCQFLSRLIWKMKFNPDNNSIPILTALGDLLGSILLLVVFSILSLSNFQGFTVTN
uniref:SLC41A/MgtE integral membrane domain-containing protein n=1 Tax=Acrobeloides nanus TaxID=290746 RepID=A0A914DWL3_9BILA